MIELKPCPACGSEAIITGCGGLRAICKNWDCQMTGPRKMDRDDAAAAWNALPRPLHWTKESPTEPGYYWYEEDHEKQPVYVFRGAPLHGKTTLYAQFFGEGDVVHKVSGMSGKWAGPIQKPVE